MPADTTISPSRAEFLQLAATHTLVPVYRTSPPTWKPRFLPFCASPPMNLNPFSWNPWKAAKRWAAIPLSAFGPIAPSLPAGAPSSITERGKTRSLQGRCLCPVEGMLAGQKPAHSPGLPPFTSGAVGFFAYDVVRQIEHLPEMAVDDLGVPDACLMFFDEVLAFDHVRKQIQLMVTADLGRQKPAAAYADAKSGWTGWKSAWPGRFPRRGTLRRGKLSVTSHTLKKDFPGLRRQNQGIHRRRRYLSGRAFPAF